MNSENQSDKVLVRQFSSAEKEVEEGALFALARCIALEKAGVGCEEARKKYLEPLIEGLEVHSSIDDNRIAFALFGILLDPENGDGRFLPQHSPHWLAFRRLFLKISAYSIPDKIRSRSLWTERNKESFLAQLEELRRRGDVEDKETSVQDIRGLGNSWEIHCRPILTTIKNVARTRLQDYTEITLQSVKKYFVEKGTVDIGKECGALYEVVSQIPEEAFSGVTFNYEWGGTTQAWLERIADRGVIKMDFQDEYQKAVRSARAVMFDVAAESVLGTTDVSEADAWDVERLYCRNRILNNPYTLLFDNRVLYYMADGIASEGSVFLDSLMSRLKTKENSQPDLPKTAILLELKRRMAALWVNPEYPLWLMQYPAILGVLDFVYGKDTERTSDSIGELCKNRKKGKKGKNKSKLFRASKFPIVEVEDLDLNGDRVSPEMHFLGYVKGHLSFRGLKRHLKRLEKRHNWKMQMDELASRANRFTKQNNKPH